MHHPEVKQKLQTEIDTVLGGDKPTMEIKDRLPMVDAFLLEVQRLGNILPLNLPHTTKEDFWYQGYLFPKNAIMFFMIDSVLSDPAIFPEPLKFNPERFIDADGQFGGEQKDKMIPFSTGTWIAFCVNFLQVMFWQKHEEIEKRWQQMATN